MFNFWGNKKAPEKTREPVKILRGSHLGRTDNILIEPLMTRWASCK